MNKKTMKDESGLINYLQNESDKKYIQNVHNSFRKSHQALPPAVYEVSDAGGMGQTIFSFSAHQNTERLISFETGVVGQILELIPDFLSPNTQRIYTEMGMSHKMGLLLYGPPGTGKTITARLVMEKLIANYGAVCLLGTGWHPTFIIRAAQFIRSVQDSPIVVFYDEFEQVTMEYENALLNFLDGTQSISNCIFIACTNYFDRIPDRIRFRKSRIKYTFEIKSFPIEVYKRFIEGKSGSYLSEAIISELAYKAEEHALTLDQLKHVLIDHRVSGVSIDSCINLIKQGYDQNDPDRTTPSHLEEF